MYYKISVFIKSIISVSRVTVRSGRSQALCSQACLWEVLHAQGAFRSRTVRPGTAQLVLRETFLHPIISHAQIY